MQLSAWGFRFAKDDECGPSVPCAGIVPGFLNSPPRFLGALAAMFLAHVVVRLITSPVTDLDESEQLVFTQAWRWGYGPQPPLYTWLQILVFDICGPSILGLTLLKNALLFGIYAFTYGAGRIVTRNHIGGVIAAVGLLFIPQIAWESQRDLTHSVLATMMAAATLFVFFKLHQMRARTLYLLLGLLCGLGTLSSYTYDFFLIGLLAAALSLKDFRGLVLSPWMFSTLFIAALIIAPFLLWVSGHWDVVNSTSYKLGIDSNAPVGVSALRAAAYLAGSWISHVISIVLIFVVLCRRQISSFTREALQAPMVRFILWMLCGSLLVVASTMLSAHATRFKGRWLQPIYICLPILLSAVVQPGMTRNALRRVVSVAALLALVIMVVFPARIWFAGAMGRFQELNMPFSQLAAQLRPELNLANVILCDRALIGGNLRLLFPQKTVFIPKFRSASAQKQTRNYAVVFDARIASEPSPALEELARSFGGELATNQIRYVNVSVPGKHKTDVRMGVAFFQ